MIATEAEKNPSCFRPEAEGGPHEWRSQWKTVVTEYMRMALHVANRWGKTKYLLGQMIPGREKCYVEMNRSKCYRDCVKALGLEGVEDFMERARLVDERLGIPVQESRASKRARVREAKEEGPEGKKARVQEKEEVGEEKKMRVEEAVVHGQVVPETEAEMQAPPQDVVAPAALSV